MPDSWLPSTIDALTSPSERALVPIPGSMSTPRPYLPPSGFVPRTRLSITWISDPKAMIPASVAASISEPWTVTPVLPAPSSTSTPRPSVLEIQIRSTTTSREPLTRTAIPESPARIRPISVPAAPFMT
jgi:hypothetical protein